MGNMHIPKAFRIRKSSGMFKSYFAKEMNLWQCNVCLFHEDENSTWQTGWVTYNFHSPGRFNTCIGEWVSTKGIPWNHGAT